jgi:dipeptidyl aminopeptidase/acylaminoacyl peptidase
MLMKCSDIFGFAQITEAVISPAGDAVAYVQRTADSVADRYQLELRLACIPGRPGPGPTRSLGADLYGPVWAPDGCRLAAVEQPRGEPSAAVVIVSVADGVRRTLAAGIHRPSALAWAPDGAEVAFLAVSPDSGAAGPIVVGDMSAKIDGLGISGSWRQHLFAVNCDTGAVRQLTSGDLWVETFSYSPSSGLIAYCGSGPWTGSVPRQPGAIRASRLWLMRRCGTDRRQLPTRDVSPRSLTFLADEDIIFTGAPPARAEPNGLFTVPAVGGPMRRLAGPLDRGVVVGSEHGLAAGPRTGAAGDVVFCARDGGCVRTYRTSLRDPNSAQVVAGSPYDSISALSASARGERLGYVSASADGYQRLIVHDLRSQTRTVLAQTVPPAEIWPARHEEFAARDGLKLEGWLVRGPAPGPTPLLVDVHGGSFSGAWSPVAQASKLYQQELADNGWTVLLLNARGSDGYGCDFARAAVGAWGEADAPDFHDAIDALVRNRLVDPARLAVTGYSYGGFMSNWLTATSDRFSAAVAGGSICDFVSLFGTSDMGWAMSEYDIGVRPHQEPLAALRRSPAGRAGTVRTPTLLLHGEADLRCPISQAEEWLALLLAGGCEAALVRYPGAGHAFLTQGPPSLAADYGHRLVSWVVGHVGWLARAEAGCP